MNLAVKDLIEKIIGMPPERVEELSIQMNQQQPYLLDYFFTETEKNFNTDEKDVFLYYCLVIWYVLSKRETPLLLVSKSVIIRTKEKNLKLFYNFSGQQKLTLDNKLENLCLNFTGGDLLRTIASTMLEEVRDNIEIHEENLGIMSFYYRVIIECLSEISIEDSLMDKILNFFGIKL